MKVIFLGTSGSMPSQARSSSAVAVRSKGEIILFDCGEGVQRQMVAAGVGFSRPTRIFISHLHGDHILGLPGLIQTMTLLQRERDLYIYGPRGLMGFIEAFNSILGDPGFDLVVGEIASEGIVFSGQEYEVRAISADHDGPSWSFMLEERPHPGRFHADRALALGVPQGPLWKRLQQGEDIELGGRKVLSIDVVDPPIRGLKIAYSGDTRPTEKFSRASDGADLMIHEATFDDSLIEKAEEDGHSTATQAAETARAAGAGMLILTHISSRYPDAGVLLEEAQKVFPKVKVAEDLMELELP